MADGGRFLMEASAAPGTYDQEMKTAHHLCINLGNNFIAKPVIFH